jgi:hypothetical protein
MAMENSDHGVAAFVRHYFEVVDYSYRTGQTSDLQKLSAKACVTCQRYIKSIQDYAAAKSQVTGGEVTIYDVLVPGRADDRTATGVATMDITEFIVRDTKGLVTERESAASKSDSVVDLARAGEGWLVTSIRVIDTITKP